MRIALVFSNSTGLTVTAEVLTQALVHHAQRIGVDLRVQKVKLPWQLYFRQEPVKFERLQLLERPDAIIFLENIVECDPAIDAGIPTILVPNLEWANARTERLLGALTQIWHKSLFSHARLAPRLPGVEHHYTGFTSIDPALTVSGYASFAHFRGKATSRHSREVLEVWRRNPHFPELKHQFYNDDPMSFAFAEWMSWNNVSIYAGRMTEGAYFQALSASGIHLCTSATEGFGHYINEARAMSAVAVVLDAPPMNELIDSACGVLLKPSGDRPVKLGLHSYLAEAELERGVNAILALSPDDLGAMGRNARRRYLAERDMFVARVGPLLEGLVRLSA